MLSVFFYGKFLTGYIVNLVDGGAWNSEAGGSNPPTQTNNMMGVSVAATPQTLTLLSLVRSQYPLPL